MASEHPPPPGQTQLSLGSLWKIMICVCVEHRLLTSAKYSIVFTIHKY